MSDDKVARHLARAFALASGAFALYEMNHGIGMLTAKGADFPEPPAEKPQWVADAEREMEGT